MALKVRSALSLSLSLLLLASACGDEPAPTDTPDAGGVNAAPVAGDATVTTAEDIRLDGTLTATDADGNALTYALAAAPTHGVVVVEQDGRFSYTPSPDYAGPDSFAFVAADGVASSNQGTVGITVTPVNDAPSVTGSLSMDEEGTLTLDLEELTVVDPDTDRAQVTLVGVADGEGYSVAADPAHTIVADTDVTGAIPVTVSVSDGTDTATTTLTVDIRAVNDPPVITGQGPLATNENTPITLSPSQLQIHDPDNTPDELTVTVLAGAGYTVDSTSTTITPDTGRNEPLTVSVTVSDPTSTSAPFDVTIDILPVNDPPQIIGQDDIVIAEDTTRQILPGDLEVIDPDHTFPDEHTVTLTPGANYTIDAGDPTGTTVVPAPDFAGTLTVYVTLADAAGGSDTFDLHITVIEVNDPPVIDPGNPTFAALSLDEDGQLVVGPADLNASDVDDPGFPAGFSVTLSDDSTSNHYTVEGSPAAIVPDADYEGALVVPVTVTDPRGGASAAVNLDVTVRAVDDPPTVSAVQDTTTDEDTAVGPIAFTVGDRDTPVGNLVVTASSGNTLVVPATSIVLEGTGTARTITITPAQNQSGSAVVTLSVSDGTTTVTEAFRIDVGAGNDPPTLVPLAAQVVDEDTATGTLAVTLDDVDSPVDALTLSASSSNPSLVPVANVVFGGTGANRTVRITPQANQAGSAVITLTVSDGTASASSQFTLTVNAVNDPPTVSAIADTATNEDASVAAIAFTVGDIETAAGSLTVTATSGNPTLVPLANLVLAGSGANRTLALAPEANQTGTALITVTVSDGTASATESFTLTVTALNDLPTISAIADASTNEDAPLTGVAFTIGDVETAAASLTLTATSSNPALVPGAGIVFGGSGANRTLVVTPAANQSGAALLTISVSDGQATTTEQFTLTVNAVNDPPTISALADASTNEDTALPARTVTVGDLETTATSLTVSATSSNTTLVPVANVVLGGSGASRTVSVTPAANQSGSAVITLTVRDADGATALEAFTLTVDPQNDTPTISAIADTSTPEDTATTALAFTVGDLETAAGSLTLSATSGNTTLVPTANVVFGGSGANRTVTVTPAANQAGSALITVTVSDGNAQASEPFTLTVTAVNDSPTVTAQVRKKTHVNTPLALVIGDFTVTDAPGENNTPFTLGVRAGSNYTFVGNTITPANNFVGDLTVNIRVTDSGTPAAFVDTTATVTVYDYVKDDTFTTPGNTRIVGMVVRTNDPDPLMAISASTGTTLPAGGTVTRNGNTFDAEPPIGLGNAPFTFTYTVTDADGFADTATVTVNTTTPVWYVNNALATNGNGSFTTPFNTLPSAVTASGGAASGHVIYLYAGTGSYPGATLANAQTLIGQGVPFVPTPNPSAPLPFIPAGAAPALGGPLTLNGGPFEVAGLNSTNSTGAGIAANIPGKSLVVRKVNVSGHAGAGLSVQNGTTLTVTDLVVSSPDAGSGRGIHVNNMSGAVSFTGTNGATSNGGAALEVTTAGSLSGAFTNLTATGGVNGVVVTNTTGAVTVANNVTVTNPTGAGVVLTNVGTAAAAFNFTVANKLTHTGGQIGVDVRNHQNGAITLGASGAAAGAGVSIANTAAQGIRLNRATNVTLNGLAIATTGDDGLQIVDAAVAGQTPTVTGLSIVNATLTDTGNDLGEWGIDLGDGSPGAAQVAGTVTLNNITVTRPGYGGVHLENASGTLPANNPLVINDLTVVDTGNDGHGLLLRASGTAAMFAHVLSPEVTHTHATRTNYAGDGVNAAVEGQSGAQLDVVVTNGTFRNAANTADGFPGRGDNAVRLAADGTGTRLTFDVNNNVVERWSGHGISIDVGGEGSGVYAEGFVRNNTVGLAGVPLSGSEIGNGINVLFDADAGLSSSATMQAKVAVTDNTIRNAGLNGIQVQGRDATGAQQRLDLILERNAVDTTATLYGYDVRTVTNTVPPNVVTLCTQITNNTTTGTMGGGLPMRVGATAGASFLLPGFGGSTNADVASYLAARGNPGGVSANAPTTGLFRTTTACSAPTPR